MLSPQVSLLCIYSWVQSYHVTVVNFNCPTNISCCVLLWALLLKKFWLCPLDVWISKKCRRMILLYCCRMNLPDCPSFTQAHCCLPHLFPHHPPKLVATPKLRSRGFTMGLHSGTIAFQCAFKTVLVQLIVTAASAMPLCCLCSMFECGCYSEFS